MKKVILMFMIGTMLISICGCGANKKIEETKEVFNEVVEEAQNNPFPDLTKEELLSFTWEETKAFFEENIPDYREVFLIDENAVLGESEWLNLRDILSVSLFKSAVIESDDMTAEELEQAQIAAEIDEIYEIAANNFDGVDEETKSEIEGYFDYGLITADQIKVMSLSEFKEFMAGYYVWANGTNVGYEGFESLTDEEWLDVQVQFANQLSEMFL